ncbi:MAG TPA: SDR family oxidoreductase [Myxococcota bacterium]|nr:SDR family oxidoreductase [Myxococcota bacterium]
MGDWLQKQLARRPWWMNALLVLCVYMAFLYEPWDLFAKPVARDAEVFLGYAFHGWAAKLTNPLHWFIYAAGTYGFWRMRPWMHPWAALYTAQVALSLCIWFVRTWPGFGGWAFGLAALVLVGALAVALWRSRLLFQREPALSQRYPGWAVVTGASAGIGAEFARQLARAGFSCVLTARREDRLRALALELEKEHGVATRVVAVDLATQKGPEELAAALADLEVGVLVNNAGFGLSGRFDKQDAARLAEMVALNCSAPVVVTNLLLPRMLERGSGAILITGSVAGRQPLPLHAVYAASKAFDLLFGEALWSELRGRGIDVLVVEPGSTESEFHDVAGELPHAAEPAANVVATALAALGQQPSVISGWFNWLRAHLGQRLMPHSLIALAAHRVTENYTPPEMR